MRRYQINVCWRNSIESIPCKILACSTAYRLQPIIEDLSYLRLLLPLHPQPSFSPSNCPLVHQRVSHHLHQYNPKPQSNSPIHLLPSPPRPPISHQSPSHRHPLTTHDPTANPKFPLTNHAGTKTPKYQPNPNTTPAAAAPGRRVLRSGNASNSAQIHITAPSNWTICSASRGMDAGRVRWRWAALEACAALGGGEKAAGRGRRSRPPMRSWRERRLARRWERVCIVSGYGLMGSWWLDGMR